MGNRAVITTREGFENQYTRVGVYLHWNGDRESVEAFLKYCELQGFRSPDYSDYGWARLCQVIANFFGGDGLSIGINIVAKLDTDNWDNGTYIIEDWKIVDRKHMNYDEEKGVYNLIEFLKEIDAAQPKKMQLGTDFFDAEEVSVEDVEIGDEIFCLGYEKYGRYEVVGFGPDKMLNGMNVKGLPIFNKYSRGEQRSKNPANYEGNINNYLTGKTVRRVRKEK